MAIQELIESRERMLSRYKLEAEWSILMSALRMLSGMRLMEQRTNNDRPEEFIIIARRSDPPATVASMKERFGMRKQIFSENEAS